MLTRRILLTGAVIIPIVGCTNNQIDPQKVIDAIKTACGIAVVAATITAIINAGVGLTVQQIVDIVCTGFHNAQAAQRKAGAAVNAGSTIDFVVVVNGKEIPIHAVVQ